MDRTVTTRRHGRDTGKTPGRGAHRFVTLPCLVLALLAGGGTVDANDGATPEAAAGELPSATEKDEEAARARDACSRKAEDQQLQEEARDLLRSWSCYTFRWFDGWWGDSYEFDESEVNGWMVLGAEYRDYDGLDPRLRLKVRAPLPNMSNRWDLLLGRLDEEAYITDTESRDNLIHNSGLIDSEQEDTWLLGLGQRRKNNRSGWDWSVGVRLRLPPEPYTRLSWLYRKQFTLDTDLRFRQTFFWRSDEGFGTTSRVDVTHTLGPRNVLRWEGIARVSEDTEGTRLYYGNTWYHLLQDGSGLSLLAFARAETGRPVELRDAGFELTWRRPFTREWMYLSMGPSLTWPRFHPEDERKLNLGFGLWIEMEFGNWRY
jgi:hypothetical protein